MDQIAGVKALQTADGRGRDSRFFYVYTGGGLAFWVAIDRALDIVGCSYKGLSLAWNSPAGDVHPAYYEPEDAGWLRSFQGGMMTTCGLDQIGAPSQDDNQPYGLHGRISNLPAEQINYRTYWQDDDYILEISGLIRQARLFGENITLHRTITTQLGSNRVQINDVVANVGFAPQPHLILYHFNLGFPLLDETAELQLDAKESVPRDADAKAGFANWRNLQPPTADYREQVFRHIPNADADGNVNIELRNAKLGLGWRLVYNNESLPHLFQWKMMGRGAYVLGVEPANSSGVEGRAVARQRDDLPILKPDEERYYALSFEVLTL
jgi:hypothetical protein